MARANGFIDISVDKDADADPGPSQARAKRVRKETPDDEACVIVHPVKRPVKATCAAALADGEELQIAGDTGGQASLFEDVGDCHRST